MRVFVEINGITIDSYSDPMVVPNVGDELSMYSRKWTKAIVEHRVIGRDSAILRVKRILTTPEPKEHSYHVTPEPNNKEAVL